MHFDQSVSNRFYLRMSSAQEDGFRICYKPANLLPAAPYGGTDTLEQLRPLMVNINRSYMSPGRKVAYYGGYRALECGDAIQ